jgi:hypothetical protein
MRTCSYCNQTFWFGGVQSGTRRFCNAQCQQRGALLDVADQLPADFVKEYIQTTQNSNCPECQGPGPIEVHTSYRVWSVLVLTSWNNRPRICCKKCATKAQLGDIGFSVLLGWWGFPWGIIMTPVQIGRNVTGLFYSPKVGQPSELLVKLLKLNLAARVIEDYHSRQASS